MSTSSIPLHCCVCPKKPLFSDISHLLTHIASKGHLSNYYKLKVRAGSEQPSRTLVAQYDQWYADWQVEHLMSERMYMKDTRRPRARAPARRVKKAILDPRLEQPHLIKKEPSATPTPDEQAGIERSWVPRMHVWPTSHQEFCQYTATHLEEPNKAPFEDINHSTSLLSMELQSMGSECTRLKGVIWPGMDIFDAATPEMRRKRNQKKDVSVVEKLEVSSQEVEPTEMVFTPDGSLKKQKRISGRVDLDSSPFKESSPSPQRRRPALTERDANSSRIPARPYKKAASKAFKTTKEEDDEVKLTFGHLSHKRKRDFTVFDDREDFGNPAGFTFLSSAFQYNENHNCAADQKPVHSVGVDTGALQSYTAEQNGIYNGMSHGMSNGMLPPQLLQNMPNWNPYDPFGPFAHDMPGFFSNTHPMFFDTFQGYEDQAVDAEEGYDDDDRTITAPPSEAS